MSALIAYSTHNLWQQAFKSLLIPVGIRAYVFSNLSELKDFLHQVDAKVILIESDSSEADILLLNEFATLLATKVMLLTDKSEGLRDLDVRVEVILKPVAHTQLKNLVMAEVKGLEAHEK